METASAPDIATPSRAELWSLSLAARLWIAAISLIDDAGKIAAPVVTTGYIASMGQPSPTTGFVLAVAIELGRGLTRIRRLRMRIAALALAMFSVATGLVLPLAAGNQHALMDHRRTHTGNTPKTPDDLCFGS